LGIEKCDFDFNEFSKRYNLDVSIEEVKYLEIYNARK